MNQDIKKIIKSLDDTIKLYDSKRAKNNLTIVKPYNAQLETIKDQPIGKYLNPRWNRKRTGEIIKCYLYGEMVAFDDVLQVLHELIHEAHL